jgi:hypothetical protein
MDIQIDRRAMLKARDNALSLLENSKDPEALKAQLTGMAHAIQMTLSLPSTREIIPKADALDCLMRAVAHEVQGDAERGSYPIEKAQIGLDMLRS